MNKDNTSGIDKLIKISSYTIFLILTATLFYSILKYYLILKERQISESPVSDESLVEDATWSIYKNQEFGYSLEYPLYLYPRESKSSERYKSFVVFEETEFSELKGLAVGITNESLVSEVDFIKNSFSEAEGVNLAEEKVGENEGKKFVLLRYEVGESNEEYEQKSFFIVNDGRYTLSLSTVTEQMPHVISTLKFF